MDATQAARNRSSVADKSLRREQGHDIVGMLMIKCPTTARNIPTGIEMDRTSFRRTPVFFSRTYCPFCRTTHEWFAKQAWISDTRQNAGNELTR